jgi:hypothetical protein
MSSWVDDFSTLLFKRAVLAKDQASALVGRYLVFVKGAAIALSKPLAVCVVAFVVCAAFGVRAPWLYEILIFGIVGFLLALIVVALPLLILSQAVFDLLPQSLQNAARAWQRRGGVILFCGLAAIFVIRAFRLWQAPDRMLTVVGIVALLWFGGALGWLAVSDAWRRVLAAKLWITLIIIAIVTMLPGPAGLVEELANFAGDRVQGAIHGITRPTPGRFIPASADDLRASFVDRGSGAFLLWYSKNERGDYSFYKSKGYDDLGSPLQQASTQAEFDAMVAWQRTKDIEMEAARHAEDAKRAQDLEAARIAEVKRAEEEARVKEAEQVAAAERAAKEAEAANQARLSSYVSGTLFEPVHYVVLVVDHLGKISEQLTTVVASQLIGSGTTAAGGVFSEAFVCPEGLESVEAGEGVDDLAAMGIAGKTKRVLLIRAAAPTMSASNKISGVRTCAMRMTIAVIDAKSGAKLSQFAIGDVSGAGVTDDAACSAFAERFAEQLINRREIAISFGD